LLLKKSIAKEERHFQNDHLHQGEARQNVKAELTDLSVDPYEDPQHDLIQRQVTPLEEGQAQAVNPMERKQL
jgi:hypothetical protein